MSSTCPSTEKIQQWWSTAQAKGADYIRIIKPNQYYAYEACKHGEKARISQISLASSDKNTAINEKRRLMARLTTLDPESVIQRYYQDQLDEAESGKNNSKYERRRISRIKTAKTNLSRLHAHLLPFCTHMGIHNINDLYKRESIGEYLRYLRKTVPTRSTAKAIVKTTKALLNWHDSLQTTPLINRDYSEAISNYGHKLGYEMQEEKPFLDEQQCRRILATETPDVELRAMIIAHLAGGLRDMEVQNLRWCDLNEKSGWVKVECAKGSVARYAQYPKVMQEAFAAIRHHRSHHLFANDYIFSETSYGVRNSKIKAFLRICVGVSGKDYSSNCLRRTGADCIDAFTPGLGDRQLGHAVNSRVTEMHYHSKHNFIAVNRYWDDLWTDVKKDGLSFVDLAVDTTNITRISAA